MSKRHILPADSFHSTPILKRAHSDGQCRVEASRRMVLLSRALILKERALAKTKAELELLG